MWVDRVRPWVPMVRAAFAAVGVVLGLAAGGWMLWAAFGAWALVDGAGVLGSTCRRYDAGEPWVRSLGEGWIQLVTGVFVWIWWGTGPSAIGVTLGAVAGVSALWVLALVLLDVWRGESRVRIVPGAVATVVLVAAASTLGTSIGELAAVLSVYACVFVIAATARAIQVSGRQAIRSALV